MKRPVRDPTPSSHRAEKKLFLEQDLSHANSLESPLSPLKSRRQVMPDSTDIAKEKKMAVTGKMVAVSRRKTAGVGKKARLCLFKEDNLSQKF